MSENGRDATTTATAESAATLGDGIAVVQDVVPEHLRQALDGGPPAGTGHRVRRAVLSLVLGVLLAGGVAWSAGLVPSPLSFVP